MKNLKLNVLIKISMMAVIAYVIMLFDFSLPIFPSFLQFDLSDLPALVGAFALGPVAGVCIELVKNLLHGIFNGSTAFIGEAANFAMGSVMVYVAGYIYNKNKSKKTALASLVVATAVTAVAASALNNFVLLPLYEKVLNFPIPAIVGMTHKVNPFVNDRFTLILWSILPFNLLKGAFVSAATMAVYKALSPILHDDAFASKRKVAREG